MFRNVPKWAAVASLVVPGLVAVSPISFIAAVYVMSYFGCVFTFDHQECVVFGENIGPLLYGLAIVSWLPLFLTLHLGAALYVVVAICWIVALVSRRRERR